MATDIPFLHRTSSYFVLSVEELRSEAAESRERRIKLRIDDFRTEVDFAIVNLKLDHVCGA